MQYKETLKKIFTANRLRMSDIVKACNYKSWNAFNYRLKTGSLTIKQVVDIEEKFPSIQILNQTFKNELIKSKADKSR
jgi:hypothetical protein